MQIHCILSYKLFHKNLYGYKKKAKFDHDLTPLKRYQKGLSKERYRVRNLQTVQKDEKSNNSYLVLYYANSFCKNLFETF